MSSQHIIGSSRINKIVSFLSARTTLKRTPLHSATVAVFSTVVYVYPYTLPAYNQPMICLLILSRVDVLSIGRSDPVRWLQLERYSGVK